MTVSVRSTAPTLSKRHRAAALARAARPAGLPSSSSQTELSSRAAIKKIPRDIPEVAHARTEQNWLLQCCRLDRRLPFGMRRQALAHKDQIRELREPSQFAGRVSHRDVDHTHRRPARTKMKTHAG